MAAHSCRDIDRVTVSRLHNFMKRELYFIKDSTTDLYITDSSVRLYKFLPPTNEVAVPLTKENADGIYGQLASAVIFDSKDGVDKGLRKRVAHLKKDAVITDDDCKAYPYLKVIRQCALDRKHLKDFGLVIVKFEISDDCG